jgi:serine/threonine-protein kinase
MLPFGGDSSTQVLVKQVMMPPPAARSLVAGLPAAIDAILQRALAKDPPDRYQTMAAFREALLDPAGATGAVPEAALEELSERVRRAQPMARAAVAASAATRSTLRGAMGAIATTPGVGRGPARRGRTWLAVAGAAAVVVAIAAGRAAPSSAAAPVVAAHEPESVRLTFGSDPAGAEVVGGDGRTVGKTPLSIDLPASDAAARYVLRKAGYVAKAVALIPNVSSPVFVALELAPIADPPPAPRARQAPRARHIASPPRMPPPPYEDDVLAPSFR